MTYLEFHKRWQAVGCFNIQQIFMWSPDFNRHNLRTWEQKGYISKLRKEYYAFTESKKLPDFPWYIANRIYMPSYISLETALSYYGIVPEAVIQTTSVSTLKTASFQNDFGEYIYRSVKPEMMFGYIPRKMIDGKSILFATPEKALFDLLYLNTFYETEEDMLELRLDEDFMNEEFNIELFRGYAERINNKALNRRIITLLNAYGL